MRYSYHSCERFVRPTILQGGFFFVEICPPTSPTPNEVLCCVLLKAKGGGSMGGIFHSVYCGQLCVFPVMTFFQKKCVELTREQSEVATRYQFFFKKSSEDCLNGGLCAHREQIIKNIK